MRSTFLLAAASLACTAAIVSAGASGSAGPTLVSDSSLHAAGSTVGGATVLATTRTVQHWFGTALNPDDGVTYGYNMVGANPYTCSGEACSATIPTDVIPIDVVVGGRSFDGSDVVGPVVSSPVFASEDYSMTSASTSASGGFTSGGSLSAGNTGVQLEDATMRSQFDQVGSSPFHFRLGTPVVHPTITIDVSSNHGTLVQSPRGVVIAAVGASWWQAQIQNLDKSLGYVDPTHLPIYLTNGVLLYSGNDPANCCFFGFHGAGSPTGQPGGPGGGNGNQPVQTFVWASYITPGTFNPVSDWALQDIHGLSHEIAEWAHDPFVTNHVEPWLTPTSPASGCSFGLETGDPVVGIGFAKGTNTFEQGPAPDGEQIADGSYHPEDEMFVPWFMRTAPNTISQPTQTPSVNVGRYSFLGDLNPYAGFRQPATGC